MVAVEPKIKKKGYNSIGLAEKAKWRRNKKSPFLDAAIALELCVLYILRSFVQRRVQVLS